MNCMPLKTDHPLLPVAVDAIRQAGTSYDPDKGQAFQHADHPGRQRLCTRC